MTPQVIVITGASAGIGRATAEVLARRGHNLVPVARRGDLLKEIASLLSGLGGNVESVVADVTHRDQVKEVFDRAVARFGRVDVWINNAGRGISRMPSELTDEDIDDMILVNVKSVMYGVTDRPPALQSARRRTHHQYFVDAGPNTVRTDSIGVRWSQALPQ